MTSNTRILARGSAALLFLGTGLCISGAAQAFAEAGADLAERVRAACRQQLADFKRPHEVRLVSELPRSTLEKIAKAQLRAALAAEGEAG